MRRSENQTQPQSWGQQEQIRSRRRSRRSPTTAPGQPACPGGLSPARGGCRQPPQHYRGCQGWEWGAELGVGVGGGWLRQRHEPGSTPHPPQIAGGFAVTPVLGWQRDSRTAAGQRDGSQPRWRLEGGFSSQFVCESLACCWVIFFLSVLLLFCRGEGEEGGLAPAIKAELPAAAGSSPPP